MIDLAMVYLTFYVIKTVQFKGGSPGLVVMGGHSYFKVLGFESHHWILDGHFSHHIVVKIVMFV